MKEFQERRRLRKIFFSRPVFLLFLCLAVFLGLSLEKSYKKSHDAVLRNKKVEEEVKDLEEKRGNLEASLRRLNTEIGIEEELRRKFQIKKPGEEYAVIIDDGLEETNSEQKLEENFFKKFFNFIFERD